MVCVALCWPELTLINFLAMLRVIFVMGPVTNMPKSPTEIDELPVFL